MPPVLVFRHVPFEGLGSIGPALELSGLEYEYAGICTGDRPEPDVSRYSGMILMGGPMSVNDDLACIRQEMRAVREALAAGLPMLGVCLGAQLIAKALGAKVYRNSVKEIGWFPIEFTAADPLFAGLGGTETVFHWHGETFDLPQGAVLLASSRDCRNQAYRVGENVYGLQFHLEVTPAMIADWRLQGANCGDVRELDGPIDPDFNSARLKELSATVFGRWAGLVRRRMRALPR